LLIKVSKEFIIVTKPRVFQRIPNIFITLFACVSQAASISTALLAVGAISSVGFSAIRIQGGSHANPDTPLSADEVKATIRLVAQWQMNHPAAYPADSWTMAPLYDGLIDASLVTGDPQYLAAVIRAGRRVNFAPGQRLGNADSHAAGHAWLRIALMDPQRNPEVLQRFEAHFLEILAHRERGLGWSWADALYMAPPTLVRLTQATGDSRYLDLAQSEFEATKLSLYDTGDRLFYRDAAYIGLRTPNGGKVFWSRGNGWVYASLVEVLDGLPNDHPSRAFYLDLFREMSAAILQAQQQDGLWYPNPSCCCA